MLQYFPNEILCKIFRFIRPIDLICIKTINRRIYNNIEKHLDLQIKNNSIFRKFVTRDFFKLINENCVISGSALLQFLLDEQYDKFDIDIYIRGDNENYRNMVDYLISIGYSEGIHSRPDNRYNFTDSIFIMYEFVRDNFKIQLILCCKDIKTVISDFDFSFVKNYYDNSIKIFNKESILKKHSDDKRRANIDPHHYDPTLRSTISRIRKYIKRGFSFMVSNEYKHWVVDIGNQVLMTTENGHTDWYPTNNYISKKLPNDKWLLNCLSVNVSN